MTDNISNKLPKNFDGFKPPNKDDVHDKQFENLIEKDKNGNIKSRDVNDFLIAEEKDGEYIDFKDGLFDEDGYISKEKFVNALFEGSKDNAYTKEELGEIYRYLAASDVNDDSRKGISKVSKDELAWLASLGNKKDSFMDPNGLKINEKDIVELLKLMEADKNHNKDT